MKTLDRKIVLEDGSEYLGHGFEGREDSKNPALRRLSLAIYI